MTLFLRFIGISGVILFGALLAFIVAKPEFIDAAPSLYVRFADWCQKCDKFKRGLGRVFYHYLIRFSL
jgi:hypothetical protein